MKRRGAEDSVECAVERQKLQISFNKRDPLREARLQMFTRRTQHILREIHRHDAATRQQIQQFGSDASRAASGIQHGFISAQGKP